MMGEVERKMVCVTGASGYIGSWIVNLLLNRGYIINAAVRNPAKAEHLMGLKGGKERIHIFKADLMVEGSFDNAISGCQGVFHVASPVNFTPKDPKVELLDPAVKGTLNVLKSCKRCPSVRRVIFTSSLATMLCSGRPLPPNQLVDETYFSDPNLFHGSDVMWYLMAKTLAEETAWKFSKENGIDMISINPSMCIGPMLQPTLNDSVAAILNLINGSESYPDKAYSWVHVEDVAEAHVRAFEIPSANGRYCLSEITIHFSEILNILRDLYPSLTLPHKCEDDKATITYQTSKEKAKSLGIKFIPLRVAIKDTVDCLIAKDFIKT